MVMVVLGNLHTKEWYFDGHLCRNLRLTGIEKPTIVVQVDRSDLDFQLYENFVLWNLVDVQHGFYSELRQLSHRKRWRDLYDNRKFRLKQGNETN
jgi:type I restriction enzyme R subunit